VTRRRNANQGKFSRIGTPLANGRQGRLVAGANVRRASGEKAGRAATARRIIVLDGVVALANQDL